jgi:hypothetical protein
MSAGLALYRIAARVLAATVLDSPDIAAVCVRRSVASGEATFPLSDLDFDLTIAQDCGGTLARVWRRYRLARLLFPRTGQCFVLTAGDVETVAALEPYRASLNRRCGLAVRGSLPYWPERALAPMELARRVVFWLEEYFPTAVRTGHRRNQRKFLLEMYNALGVLECRWSEPRISLGEVESAYETEVGTTPFASGLEAARRALACLGLEAPPVTEVIELPGLTILPAADHPWPASARGVVATSEALVLLLRTQRPTFWLEHGAVLSALGFSAPPPDAWFGVARRLASPQWPRGPGFFEPLSGAPSARLVLAEHLTSALESGRLRPLPPAPGAAAATTTAYYERVYDGLAARARALRDRLAQLATDGSFRCAAIDVQVARG